MASPSSPVPISPMPQNTIETKKDSEESLTSLLVVKATTIMFLVAPPLAFLIVGIFMMRPSWETILLAVGLYVVSMAGITIGFHRMLTHKGFVASPWLRWLLTVAGSTSFQGSPIGWVAVHRKHHQMSDKAGDPHSPHGYGSGFLGVVSGFWHGHAGWLFDGVKADVPKYAPDMEKDKVVKNVDRTWWIWGVTSLIIIPGTVGWFVGVSGWWGAVTAILWAGFIRVGLAHHAAWSVNSVCHLWGKRPFVTRDESRNVAWLAPFVLGESFHNAHHAFPASPRHGLLPHQWDASARMIRWFELAGWVHDVKWYGEKQMVKKLRLNDTLTSVK